MIACVPVWQLTISSCKAILRHRDNTDIVKLEMMVTIRYWWQNSKLGAALFSAWCYWKERMGMTMNNVTNISNSSTYFVATFVTNIDVVSSWCHERENHLKRKTRLKDTGCTLFRYICKNQPTQALVHGVYPMTLSDITIWYHYLWKRIILAVIDWQLSKSIKKITVDSGDLDD